MSSRLPGQQPYTIRAVSAQRDKVCARFLSTPNNPMKTQMILKLSTENFALSVDCFPTQGSAAEP